MSAEATTVAVGGRRLYPVGNGGRLTVLAAASVARAAPSAAGSWPPVFREGDARRTPSLSRPPATPEAWSAGLWGSFA